MKKSVRLYIEGNVQGILFRSFIKENAEKQNVKGFTRNLEDGRVEVFIEGDTNNVDKMIEICKKGPKYSQIKNMQIKPETFQGFKDFKVLHI
ncbi:acylphosphatase [Candidatus Pacearchaeota archaeon]|nr:acylphosphatase [Candidatus Pacearchaeota archaeon]